MKIEKYHYKGKVYNIEVEPNHETKDDQFYVNAENGVVVHNCHPRDNIALRWLADEYAIGYDMFETIMRAREVQAENLANFLVEQSIEHDLPIVIHGKAYKPDVPYEIGSYSILVGHYVKNNPAYNKELHYVDPLTGDDLPATKAVILLAHNREITYAYTGRIDKQSFYFDAVEGSVIVDPWRKSPTEYEKYKVIHYGNTRPQ